MTASIELFIHRLPKPAVSEAHPPQDTLTAHTKHTIYKRDTVVIRLQHFNPNTADSITLLQLGLKPWQVRNMLKYRAKKGVYRKKEDLKKLYGMTDSIYSILEPYIDIPKRDSIRKDSLKTDSTLIRPQYVSRKKDTILELNTADTATLQLIRGIGRYTAVKIVRYRSRLGGYADTSQLREIEDTEYMYWDSVIPHFIVNTDSIQRIRINQASVDRMQRHPYLSFTQAQAVYNLRRRYIRLNSIDDLKDLPFTESELQRLEPYLDFGR